MIDCAEGVAYISLTNVGSCAGFSDGGNDDGTTGLGPASEKRQGTKSRDVGQRGCNGRYGD